jgi:signal transduction histidine kinase
VTVLWSRALGVASVAAVAAVVVAIAVRVAVPNKETATTGTSWDTVVPLLMAAAALCVLGLTVRRRPGVAWLAIVATLAIVTIDVASALRSLDDPIGSDPWRRLAVVLCVMASGAVGAAIAYAAVPARRIAWWLPLVGGAVLAWMIGVSMWALADPTRALVSNDPATDQGSPLGALGVVTRSMLAATLVFVGLGLIGDARAPAARARRRLAVMRPSPTTLSERASHATAFIRVFIDEVSPGRSRAHRAALDERSRIARDLHADVVPAIRRALSEAERDGSAARLAGSLRDVLGEVGALVASEHAIVLDVSGFVAAVEALAERTEERSAVRVTIDILAADGEPPPEVGAAALRVATLALENVSRHADGASAVVTVRAAGDGLEMAIEDDGPGLAPAARQAAIATGRRGLADMAAEASAAGAALEVGARSDDGAGARVAFRWPAV